MAGLISEQLRPDFQVCAGIRGELRFRGIVSDIEYRTQAPPCLTSEFTPTFSFLFGVFQAPFQVEALLFFQRLTHDHQGVVVPGTSSITIAPM